LTEGDGGGRTPPQGIEPRPATVGDTPGEHRPPADQPAAAATAARESAPVTAAADRRRWLLLAGVWAMYVAFGLVVASLAPVLTPLGEDLGLSKSRLGAILGTWPAVFIFAAVPCGRLLDRIGLRWALLAGGVLMGLSGMLRGLATGSVTLFVAVGIFGLGAPMISNGAPKLVVSWFEESERAKATGIYVTGPVVGQAVALAAANSVIVPVAGGSWRSVPLVFAAVTGAVCVLWLILTARIDSSTPQHGPGPTGGSTERAGAVALARNPVMRLVLAMAVAVFFVNHGLNNWLPKIIEDGGLSAENAGYLTAAAYAAGLLGPLTLPRLGNRYPLAAPVAVSLSLGAVIAMLTLVSGLASTPFLVLIGILRFGLIGLCLLALMRVPGVDGRNMGIASGLFFMAGEIGGFGGPFAVGAIGDATGGFDASLLTLTASAILVAALFGVIHRRSARAVATGTPVHDGVSAFHA